MSKRDRHRAKVLRKQAQTEARAKAQQALRDQQLREAYVILGDYMGGRYDKL